MSRERCGMRGVRFAWRALGMVLALALGAVGPLPAQNPVDAAVQAVMPSDQQSSDSESSSREDGTEESGVFGPDPPDLPGIEELVPQALEIERQALEAAEEARSLGTVDEQAATVAELEPDARQVVQDLGRAGIEPPGLATRVVSLQQRLDQVSDGVRRTLRDLEGLRSDWREERDLWSVWRDGLVADERPVLAEEAETSLERIAAVLATADASVDQVIELQRRVEAVRMLLHDAVGQLDTRGGLEIPSGRRDAAPLGSRLHRDRLRQGLLGPVSEGIRGLEWPGPLFWERHHAALGFQLVLAVVVFLLARFFRGWSKLGEEWTGLLRHPWALGIFVATLPSHLLYELPPPLWRLLLWTLFAASSTVLAAVAFRSAAKRRAVYGLAGVFTLLLLAEVIGVPGPWIRVLVALVALGGIVSLLIASRMAAPAKPTPAKPTRKKRDAEGDRSGEEIRSEAEGDRDGEAADDTDDTEDTEDRAGESVEDEHRGFRLLVRLSAALLAVVVVTELLGYDTFARGLLESALATAFAVLVVTLLLRLGRGAIQGAVTRSAGRFPVLRRVGYRLSIRLGWLFQAVVMLVAAIEIAVLWGLFPSSSNAFGTVWSWNLGLGVGSLRLGQVLLALLAVYMAFLLSTVLRSTLEGDLLTKRELDPGVSNAITTLLHYLMVTVGFFVALSLIGIDLDNLTLVIGALGVGVGLGLQDLVKNFFSGLVLLFERPVRVGDVLMLDGDWSTVKKIGLRATTVVTLDRSEIIVPNGDLTSEKVTNWTLSDALSRVTVRVGVAYGSDLEKVFEVLQGAAGDTANVLEDPAPVVLFVGFGDSSLDFELRAWVVSIDHRLPVLSALHTAVDRGFRKAGITIPFPQRDLWMKSLPERAQEKLDRETVVSPVASEPDDEPESGPETGTNGTTRKETSG